MLLISSGCGRYAHLEWFCTEPGEEGRYYLAVQAAPILDPEGPTPGYVMQDGSRPTASIVPNPGKDENRVKQASGYYTLVSTDLLRSPTVSHDLPRSSPTISTISHHLISRQARGYYTLRVTHWAFEAGPLVNGETRVGCASFGQVRAPHDLPMISP